MCATTCGRVSLHGQGPPPQDTPLLDAVPQALRRCQGQHRVGVGLHGRHVSAVLGEDGGIEFRIHQTGDVPGLLGLRQGFLAPLLGLVRIAQRPQDPRELGESHDPALMPTAEDGLGGWGVSQRCRQCSRWARAVTSSLR